MSKKGITKKVITASIDADLEQKLREIAASENRSFSQVVETSIAQSISNFERAKALPYRVIRRKKKSASSQTDQKKAFLEFRREFEEQILDEKDKEESKRMKLNEAFSEGFAEYLEAYFQDYMDAKFDEYFQNYLEYHSNKKP